jgi:hypothetical protein
VAAAEVSVAVWSAKPVALVVVDASAAASRL